MKYTMNVPPFRDLYYVKKDVQYYLMNDQNSPTTSILIRLNKYVEWDLDESKLVDWAKEVDFAVTAEKLERKGYLAYRVRRVS